MKWLEKIADVATNGFVSEVFGVVKDYFPPGMSPQQQHSAKIAIENIANKRAREIDKAINEGQALMIEQISALEGTAKELKTIPFVGSLIIFLRATQRPLWGFLTMYLDFVWLTKPSSLYSEQQQTALIIINLLVLAFLFGERGIRNCMPLITRLLRAKAG